jgi:transposase-like protein
MEKIKKGNKKEKTDHSVGQRIVYDFRNVPSEAKLRKFMRSVLFGKNLFCPHCLSRFVKTVESRYHCSACRTKFSVLSFTGFSHLRVSYQRLWLAFWCWTNGMNHDQSAILCRITTKCVRHWFAFFNEFFPASKSINDRILQLDETLFKDWAPIAHEVEEDRQKNFKSKIYIMSGRHEIKRRLIVG